ncbi:MAG: tetratricopeptide repeat protein [Anaerolineae bacterium]|nr:MAG: tetratricopeptide repeat protein [Anaerolineae bacterium]
MYTTFINYTNEDEILAKRIYADLLKAGIRPWMTIYDAAPGDDREAVTQTALENSPHVVVIVTKKSQRDQSVVNLTTQAAGKNVIGVLADLGVRSPEGAKEVKLKRRYGEALQELATLLPADSEPLSEVPPFQQGNEAYALEDYDGAVEQYTAAIKADETHAAAYNGRAAAYNAVRQHQKALDDVNKAIELNPEVPKYYRNRSLALSGLRRHEEALADDQKGLELEPSSSRVWSSYGMTLLALGRFDEARAAVEKALELRPNEAHYLYQLGVIASQAGNLEAALECYTKALALDPENADIESGRRLVLGRLGRYDEVLAEVDREMKKNPRKGGVYITRSLINFYMERYEDAVKDATMALERGQASQPAAYYNRAIAHWKAGHIDQAKADLLLAISLMPELGSAAGIQASAESELTREPGLAILETLQTEGKLPS